jgi:hypothetical protein
MSAYDPKRTSVGFHLVTTGVPAQPATIRFRAHHSSTTRRGHIAANLAKLPGLVCKSFAVQAQHRYRMTQNANLLFIRVR